MAVPDHARLRVYHKSVALVEPAERLARAIPLARADLRSQLRRACTSIVLNIAEGAGEFRAAEKRRFYRMARRSASEVMAVLDICDALYANAPTGPLRPGLDEIAAMLTALAREPEVDPPS